MNRRPRSKINPFALVIFLVGIGIFVGVIVTRQPPPPAPEATQTLRLPGNDAANGTPSARPPTTAAANYDTEMVITSLGVTAPIIPLYFGGPDNWDLGPLNDRVGHLEGTPEIGQGGNVVMVAHVELKDGRLGPFARLGELKVGDTIRIVRQTPQGVQRYFYAVTEIKTVAPTDVNVMRYRGLDELTLITCRDWNQQAQSYEGRIIVHAVGRPA